MSIYWWILAAAVTLVAMVWSTYRSWVKTSKQYPVLDPAGSAIFITGASSGIGKDCALTLCKTYTVFATVRKESDADSLKKEVVTGTLIPVIADVAKPEQLEAALKTVVAELQKRSIKLAALINNAGINLEEKLLDNASAEWPASRDVIQGTLDVNVVGLLDTTRLFLPVLKESRGRIINIGSYYGSFAPLGLKQLGYSASKHAVEAISDGLRRGLDDVAVILLKPGNIVTAMNAKHGEDGSEIITAAIVTALQSSRPPSRMFVGRVKGIPMWFICRLFGLGPDWLSDLLL